jgi:arabinofuranosyltransferase
VLVADGMGFTGYFAGPVPHLLDPMGLTDPLLARLPIWRDRAFLAPQKLAQGMSIPWRIGHFVRAIPAGYEATLASGVNQIASPALAECWETLALITRAPLTAPGRWRAILRANLGSCDGQIERYLAGE